MAGPQEMFNFVTKFQNLWHAGKQARLYIECEAGDASINLQLYLGHHQHPPQPHQPQRQSPSRLRRRAKRAEAREVAAANAAQAPHVHTTDVATQATVPNIPTTETAVQAVPNAIEAAVQASVPVPTTEEIAVQVSPAGSPTSSPSTPAAKARPNPRSTPAAQFGLSPKPRSDAQSEHPQRMYPADRYLPTFPWTPQREVHDMVCPDLDYDRELAIENQREKDRQENVRKTLQMIEQCIGPPK